MSNRHWFIFVAIALVALAAGTYPWVTDNPSLKQRIQHLFTKASAPAAKAPLPDCGEFSPVLFMLDEVGLHHKNGLTETYGAALRPRQSGPIRIGYHEILPTHDQSMVVWTPDYSPMDKAANLVLEFVDPVEHGKVAIRVRLKTGETLAFSRLFGEAFPAVLPAPLPALVPEDFLAVSTETTAPLEDCGAQRYSARLPPLLVLPTTTAGRDFSDRIEWIQVLLEGTGPVKLRKLGFVTDKALTKRVRQVSIDGKVTGENLPPGTRIDLVTESGASQHQALATDQSYHFTNLPADALVSVRLWHSGRNYYSNQGRWLNTGQGRSAVNIPLTPLFQNPEGKIADASKAKFVTPREPTQVSALYESHARQIWPGGGSVQEYDSITFTNNYGFIDRDRFFENPDHCLRIVHLGSSHAVALQVKPAEKYNIELESELAVRLQRCVEVISAGRDNGDIGSNYPRIRDYAVRFHPDAILLENSNSLVMQLHPILLKTGFGWDHDYNALDHFSYSEQGILQFRAWSAEYGLHAVKPDFTPLVPGVPLMQTLYMPLQKMPSTGIEAFQYLSDTRYGCWLSNSRPRTKGECTSGCTPRTYRPRRVRECHDPPAPGTRTVLRRPRRVRRLRQYAWAAVQERHGA